MGWYEAIKDLAAIASRSENIELTQTVIQLQAEMIAMQQRIHELSEANRALEAQIARQEEVVPRAGVYWRGSEQGDDGPYCTACFDDRGKLIRLAANTGIRGMYGHYECPICKTTTRIEGEPPPTPRRRRNSPGIMP